MDRERERVVGIDYDLKKPMSFLKDALRFACKADQSLNRLRRTLIRQFFCPDIFLTWLKSKTKYRNTYLVIQYYTL